MGFALTPRMLEMQSHLQVFLDRHILPANVEWNREVEVVGISQRRLLAQRAKQRHRAIKVLLTSGYDAEQEAAQGSAANELTSKAIQAG